MLKKVVFSIDKRWSDDAAFLGQFVRTAEYIISQGFDSEVLSGGDSSFDKYEEKLTDDEKRFYGSVDHK